MSYEIKYPIAALRPYIQHLAISRSEDSDIYKVLPDTSLVIGFQFSGQLNLIEGNMEYSLDSSGVTGLLDSYRLFKNVTDTGSILIVFTEMGAANFLTIPINELFGQSVNLEHFFSKNDIQETQEKLGIALTDSDRVKVIERFLLSQLRERKADQLVAGALYHIHQSKGTIRIKAMAELLHTSQSPLEKRFRAIVGASPKKFAGIVRARHMLSAMNDSDQNTAEHLSAFYDQAHFIKDFKKFSSMTPDQYLRAIRDQRK